jgi:hypothetical protein
MTLNSCTSRPFAISSAFIVAFTLLIMSSMYHENSMDYRAVFRNISTRKFYLFILAVNSHRVIS